MTRSELRASIEARSPGILALYTQARTPALPHPAPAFSAVTALRAARAALDAQHNRLDWHSTRSGCTCMFRDSGFAIHATLESDEYSAWPDYLGRFTDGWAPGAIDLRRAGLAPHRGAHRYFIPACDPAEVAGTRDYFSRIGYAKHTADLLARAIPQSQCASAVEYLNLDRAEFLLRVRAYRCGVELASDVLGGISLPCDFPNARDASTLAYVAEIVEDATASVTEAAREKLDDLSAFAPADERRRVAGCPVASA